MNMNREYKIITINQKHQLKIEFADSRYDLLGTFFFADYSAFGDWIDKKIAEVVSGKEESQNISGNVCELVISKDTVKVLDTLAEDGMGKWCELATDEMIELMKEWRIQKAQLHS